MSHYDNHKNGIVKIKEVINKPRKLKTALFTGREKDMSQDKYIVIGTKPNTPLMYCYSDLYLDERVIFIEQFAPIKNKILNYIRHAHTGKRINHIINLPFKSIWHSPIDDIKWEKGVKYHIITFFAPTFRPNSYWKKLKEKYGVDYTVFLLSSVDSYFVTKYHLFKDVQTFDSKVGIKHIMTSQQGDAKKYGFALCYNVMSIIETDTPYRIENDLFLINAAKGRLEMFHKVYESAKKHGGIKLDFRIVEVKKKDQLYPSEIIYNKTLNFVENVAILKKSNCILEVLGHNMTSPSNHWFEAVLYNKKLLTDNKDVLNLPFYNPDYIKVFEDPEDIDWDWVKERVPVDYHYDGRFSPIHLIDKIIELDGDM